MSANCRLYTYVDIPEYKWTCTQAKTYDVSYSEYIKALIKEKFKNRKNCEWDPRLVSIQDPKGKSK